MNKERGKKTVEKEVKNDSLSVKWKRKGNLQAKMATKIGRDWNRKQWSVDNESS